MSSSSPSMSAMEMEESSDTSREDRKSRHHRPPSVHQPKGRQITRNFAHPPPVSHLLGIIVYTFTISFNRIL